MNDTAAATNPPGDDVPFMLIAIACLKSAYIRRLAGLPEQKEA